MLILKPVNGVWYVQSSGYPQGHWAAYSDHDVAREFLHWLVECHFDCDSILRRLYAGKLTARDRNTVRIIYHQSAHRTRVVSQQQPVEAMMAAARKAEKIV